MREVIRRNRVRDGIVYMQIPAAWRERDLAFPAAPGRPGRHRQVARIARQRGPRGAWRQGDDHAGETLGAPDIKTLGLLPNVLAKQAARDAARPRPGSSARTAW